MVEKEVAVQIAQVRRYRRAVGAAVRRAVGDEAFWMRCLYMPLVRLESSLQYETWVRARSCAVLSQMRLTSSDISANAPIAKTSTRPPLYLLSAATICPSEPGGWPLSSSIFAARLR